MTSRIVIQSTIQPVHEKVYIDTIKLENDLKIDREKFEVNGKQLEKTIKKADVIRLNVGVEIMMATRQTLTRD
jgi:hypothetical protein